MTKQQRANAYWQKNIRLVLKLMAVWFIVSFGFGILLVDLLNTVTIGGFKLGFFFATQGSIYVFVGLIFYYVHRMDAIDREFGVDEE